MIRLTSSRIRSLAAYCANEKELINILRYHKIPFSLDCDGIGIPSRKGILRARRIRSRFEIHNASPVPFRPDTMEV